MRTVVISQPRYLPFIGYFSRIHRSDVFIILNTVKFKIKEFDRRNKLRSYVPPGWFWLSVPVKRSDYNKNINEVVIDQESNWREKHWRSIEMGYARAPYFKDYKNELKKIYSCKWSKIQDLQISQIRLFMEFLNISSEIVLSSDLRHDGKSTDLLISLVKEVGGDAYLYGKGGQNYLDVEKMKSCGILPIPHDFHHPEYSQVHGGFIPYMAIIDLLFNEGPKSEDIVKSS